MEPSPDSVAPVTPRGFTAESGLMTTSYRPT